MWLPHPSPAVLLALAIAVLATACSGDRSAPAPTVDASVAPQAASTGCIPSTDLPGGAVPPGEVLDRDFPWERDDPAVLAGFDADRIISGGPPPDGIRPIDAPCMESIEAASAWLSPNSPVLVVQVGDDRRAYPLAILTQHEIVNDVVGGVPLAVTYCPLCNSGLVFERTVDGQVLDFGTSGRLFQSNLVMYDRQTKSLWSQFLGRAVMGRDHVGTDLVRLPTSLVHWSAFAQAGEGLVLSRDSDPTRTYGRNPYPGYEGNGDTFLFEGPRDDALPPNTRVVGLGVDADPVAVPLDRLAQEGVVRVEVDGEEVTVWWVPGQASALDTSSIDEGIDVGSTVAFSPVLPDGSVLTFSPIEGADAVQDDQTGSTWDLFGTAVTGELQGAELQAVPRDDTFWFVWFAFQPDTRVERAT